MTLTVRTSEIEDWIGAERRLRMYRNMLAIRAFEEQVNDLTIISGTPKTVLPKIRHVLEYLRPGSIFFWDGDGAMTHEDQMRSLRLMGEEVIPAVREMGEELELFGPFEVDPATGKPFQASTATDARGEHRAKAEALPQISA